MQLKCLENHGVEFALQSKPIQKKFKKTLLEKYGVSNACELRNHVDWQKAWEKQHQTKKRNGSYGKSKIEDSFYEYLCFEYGKENIERQILVNNWSIDFHIKTKDTYIQFDGVYYHGLDRPLEEIKKFNTKRDAAIYKVYCRDIEQNKWFKNNNMKLIRVREDNFKAGERLDV